MIQETKEIILGSPYFNNIKKITVYGSAADNELTLRSDIDLAVDHFHRIDGQRARRRPRDNPPFEIKNTGVARANDLPFWAVPIHHAAQMSANGRKRFNFLGGSDQK